MPVTRYKGEVGIFVSDSKANGIFDGSCKRSLELVVRSCCFNAVDGFGDSVGANQMCLVAVSEREAGDAVNGDDGRVKAVIECLR